MLHHGARAAGELEAKQTLLILTISWVTWSPPTAGSFMDPSLDAVPLVAMASHAQITNVAANRMKLLQAVAQRSKTSARGRKPPSTQR